MSQFTTHQYNRIVTLLEQAFDDNLSVNYVLKQDSKRKQRMHLLMQYTVFQGEKFGKVYLSEDENSCAVILYPEKKRTTLGSIIWDIRLAVGGIGIFNIRKVLQRQKLIYDARPIHDVVHLWYIGVDPTQQGKGLGSMMLELIKADHEKPVFLETSNPRNFSFYESHGFELIKELHDLGYPLRMYAFTKGSMLQ